MCDKMKSSFINPQGICPVFQDGLSICGDAYSSSPVDGSTCLRSVPVRRGGMLFMNLRMTNNDPMCLSVLCRELLHTRMVKRRQGDGNEPSLNDSTICWLSLVNQCWALSFFILKTKPERSSHHHANVEHKVATPSYFLKGHLYFSVNLPPSRSVCC